MTGWFSGRWIGAAVVYLSSVLLLATYAFSGHHLHAYLVLLGLTAPGGPLLPYPLDLAAGLADSVSGHELDGSPVSISVGIAGFMVAAAINVVLVRVGSAIVCSGRHSRIDAR